MDDDEDMGVRAAFALGLELEFESAGLVAQNHAVYRSIRPTNPKIAAALARPGVLALLASVGFAPCVVDSGSGPAAAAAAATPTASSQHPHPAAAAGSDQGGEGEQSRWAAQEVGAWRTGAAFGQAGEYRFECKACNVNLCSKCYDGWKGGDGAKHDIRHRIEIIAPILHNDYGSAPPPPPPGSSKSFGGRY
eukprot:gene8409-17672_t